MEEKVCQEGTSSATSENLQEQEGTGASSHPLESEIIITVRPEKTEAEASSDPAPEIAESRMVEKDEEKERSKNGENEDCTVNSCNETVNDEDRVCRICHLSHDHHSILIQLGCSCKDELGISHPHCAETWFKHKGNRRCEICGETAQNVVGFREKGHTTERNQRRVTVRSSTSSSGRVSCCGTGRKGCNLFLTGLVLAFLFIWIFHLP